MDCNLFLTTKNGSYSFPPKTTILTDYDIYICGLMHPYIVSEEMCSESIDNKLLVSNPCR